MPMHENELRITTLPPDILIFLMGLLHPLDLMAVGKTCRYLHEIHRQRIVWTKALTDVCVENDVFLPTFQIDRLSTEQLIRAAIAPSRFSALLRRNQNQTLVLTDDTILDLKLPVKDVAGTIFLVAGGRFIVVLSLTTLQLLDAEGDQKLVACRRCMDRQSYSSMSVQPTKNGMGLRVAVVVELDYHLLYPARHQQTSVYEIFPLGSEPTFCEIAVTDVAFEGVLTPIISGDHLVIVDEKRDGGYCLWVWDFLKNLWAIWDGGKAFDDVCIISGTVLLLKDEGAVVLELRNLEPLGSYLEPSPIVIKEMHADSLLPERAIVSARQVLSRWPRYSRTQNIIVDLLADINRETGKSLVRGHKIAPEIPRREGPSLIFQSAIPSVFQLGTSTQYRISEGDLVGYFRKADGAYNKLVLMVRSNTKRECFAFLEPRWNDCRDDWYNPSLCPISGRICYRTGDRRIVVADIRHSHTASPNQ